MLGLQAALMLAAFAPPAAAAAQAPSAPTPCERQWQLSATHPHDPTHFTQGLVLVEGRLFESTGQYGQSAVIEVDRATGKALRTQPLPANVFGEGLALAGGRLVQLSWREQTAFFYDLSLKPQGSARYPGEGWGLTALADADGERLVLSDGTPWLRILDPATLEERRRIMVRVRGEPLKRLNELETVRGEILANIWYSDEVAVIDPVSGDVTGWFDFAALRARLSWPPPMKAPGEAVLNGLAWDDSSGRLLVTGKYWPSLFEVQIGGCRAAQ